MKNKFAIQLLLLILSVFMLTGCGSSSMESSENDNENDKEYSVTASLDSPKSSQADLEETPVEDFRYEYDAALQGVVIKGYTGTSIKVRIPDSIEGEPVTGIGAEAFRNCGCQKVHFLIFVQKKYQRIGG